MNATDTSIKPFAPASEPRELALLAQARVALAEARTVNEVKRIRDKAEAIRMYVRAQGESLELQNYACELKLQAERRAGELLSNLSLPGGDRKSKSHDETLKLSDMNLSRADSSRWQRIAALDQQTFDDHIARTVEAGEELTTAGLLRVAKQASGRKHAHEQHAPDTTTDLHDLVAAGHKFGTVYADPPWAYDNAATRSSATGEYRTMTVDEIAALPVRDLAAADAHLHLWVTKDFLFESKRVLDAWGFTYKSIYTWCKTQIGMGNYWRMSNEFMLLGVRGDATRFNDHSMRSWDEFARTEHSRKPEAIRQKIEKASPGPRLELFARQLAHGWTCWGNQIERTMFDTAEAV